MLACTSVALSLACADVAAAGTPGDRSGRPATVTVADARFEVLSPTLIRTEYAGDGRFEDSATFNAIGRNAFTPRPSYTSTVKDGVLTLTTSALTLRYQVGSGPFDAHNLTVQLTAGQNPVLAAPWRRSSCTLGTLCEAEDQAYDGPGIAVDHPGFTGKGFLAGFEVDNNSLSTDVRAPAAGTYDFAVRYANSAGSDGRTRPARSASPWTGAPNGR